VRVEHRRSCHASLSPQPRRSGTGFEQADRDQCVRNDGLTTDEREELSRLFRELRQVKQEWEILAKAAAWFAQETEHGQKSSRS
jgi:transposase